MLRDIDKDTVDWDPNFDETRREPRVLPCRFPNLLVNGSSGIAVGMATNIPPHNLTEVINACVCVLENPDATLSDLMQHVTGPDFPTRGIIVGRSGIRAAYATGRGRIVVRARTETETWGHDRIRIIVTELPYQVNKRQLIQNISEQVRDKKLDGISGLRDESDRNGMRIVIELKKDANTQVVLNRLFAQTQMQTTFAVNMLALVDNQSQPKILSLRHILDEYLTFQEEIIVRRTKFDLKKALERAHLLEGLLIAEENIDEVIRIIRESYDDAKENLMQRFSLSDVQAQAILDMRLKALQGLEREKLQNEYDELEKRIAYFRELLADPEKVKAVLRDELIAIRDKYGDERKTEIQDIEDDIDIEDLIEEEQCVFTLSHGGNIKRVPVDEYTAQKRGGKGVRAATLRDEDYVDTVFTASTHDYILFFTDRGRCYRKKGYLIPEAGRTARGVNIVNFIQVEKDEKVNAMLHVREMDDDSFLVFATRNGTVKRMPLSALRNIRTSGIRALTLDEGDELINVMRTDGSRNILMATHNGQAICFAETDVRPMGREAVGVRGIRLKDGDWVVGAEIAQPDAGVLSITENGYGKRTPAADYIRGGEEPQHRGGSGMKNYNITDKTGPVAAVKVVYDTDDVLRRLGRRRHHPHGGRRHLRAWPRDAGCAHHAPVRGRACHLRRAHRPRRERGRARRGDRDMKQVTIYTDGACSGNPGPGGWGAILRYGAHEKELSGGEPSTTNNRMELLGAITALQSLREPCQVSLYTDSQYLANAVNLGWLRGWKQKGWHRKDGELKNADLWQTLDGLLQTHKVQFFWVKGHADNVYNNRCDALAVAEREKFA